MRLCRPLWPCSPLLNQAENKMSEAITINKADLADLLKEIVPAAGGLPRYYRFPEDIVAMLGGKPAVSTVRSWKSYFGLRTVKIGGGTYVTQADWDWWVKNNQEIFAAAERSKKERLAGRSMGDKS